MRFRILIMIGVMLMGAQTARADYVDVIVNRYVDGCTVQKYTPIVAEFHGVMKSQGYTYRTEISVPFYADNMDVLLWVGRVADIGVFGKENAKWQAATQNPSSPEAKVQAKLNGCTENVSRSAYLTVE